ncbi:MAG TPA: FecR domain-containing protein [Sphingobium sp.]|uniref:FecR domain-containing protein n=1 Tax=Sphingobium sp. TaxID=1912891 RepID=UPI002ED3BDE0
MGPRALAMLLLISVAVPVVPALAAPSDMVRYQVRQGDNLFALARAYFRNIDDYRIVQKLNRVANPYQLPVGQSLLIPRALLRYKPIEARVLAWRGDVRITHGGRPVTTAVDAVLREGDAIQTGANAFLSLGLPDDSVVALPSQSQLRVTRLRQYGMTNALERQFDIVSGRARAVVTPLKKPEDAFRFVTPSAVSAVRGTELRVAYDPAAKRGTTEVLEGHVAVDGSGRAVMVDAGRGVVAGAGGPGEPVALLSAPALVRPGMVQDADDLSFVVEPVAGAKDYHVQIAKDAGFLDVVSEAETGPLVIMPTVEEGGWFVRVSAMDANGLEGMPRTYSFKRRQNIVQTETSRRKTGRYEEFLFRWRASGSGRLQYRFQLSREGEEATPIIDELGLTGHGLVVTDLPPGSYTWRVMTIQFVDGELNQKWSPLEALTISPDE